MDTENQIPPSLPLQKGGVTPLWQRGVTCLREAASAKAGGRFSEVYGLLYYGLLNLTPPSPTYLNF